jgi:hypothetical protein
MSKWLRKDDYDMFAEQKKKEAENQPEDNAGNFFKKWKNPQMGTTEKAKEYKIRLLPDPEKGFYKEYLYHGFNSGEKFKYLLCEKTPTNLDAYCPWCEANKILYQGNATDKKKAKEYKRKNRFVSNIYVVDDPRDVDVKDAQYKVNGTVRLYEFPGTVESKVANEINDREQGYGLSIFDPEDGYDFILKVKAKPKDQNGKEWPDYGDTIFARRATPISDDAEKLDSVMEQRVKLEEYIESMRFTADEHEALLKAEMLWEDVGHNFERHFRAGGATNPPPTPTPESAPTQESAPVQESAPTPTPEASTDVDDTDALLDELANM